MLILKLNLFMYMCLLAMRGSSRPIPTYKTLYIEGCVFVCVHSTSGARNKEGGRLTGAIRSEQQ